MLRHKRMVTAKKQTLDFKSLAVSQAFVLELFSTSTALVILLAWLFSCNASVVSGYTGLTVCMLLGVRLQLTTLGITS